MVELQTLVAKQQLSKGVVEVQAPRGEKIAKDSTAKDSTLGGGDIGGGGKIAGAGLQIVKKKKLQNKRTAHVPAPHIARMTRSSVL